MPLTRILLVDASADSRARLAQAFPELEKDGAIRTASRHDAVQRAEAERPDVVLLESAGNVAQALRAALAEQKATARIPVILLADEAEPTEKLPAALAEQVRSRFAEARLTSQLAYLEDLGGLSFMHDMVDLFLETTPPRLQAARAALVERKLDAVEQAAHSLKSSAANLGADEVQELAGTIEQLAAAQQIDSVTALLPKMEEAFARISARLARTREPLP
jgi:two-component system, sensor histidine kinase and response regulator